MLEPKDLKIIEQIMQQYPEFEEGTVIKTIAFLKGEGLLKDNPN